MIENTPPGDSQATPPPARPVPLGTFVVVVALILALGGGAIAWILVSDDNGDSGDEAAAATTTTTEAPADSDDEADPLDDLDSLLGGAGGASMECLTNAMGDMFGGDRLELGSTAREQYEAIAHAVEAERELTFEQIPEPTFVTSDEMAERIAALTERDYPDDVARADEELLTALGAIEPGTDLFEENVKLLGDQVAGYYDPLTGDLVVLGDDEAPFDAIEMTIIAHELEHALADQALELPIEQDPNTDDPDGAMAGRALAEGDALLTQTYFQAAAVDPLELLSSALGGDVAASQEALDAAPEFLARQLMFPYEDGLAFVCGYQQQGWDAVDDVYRAPPTTTAQILFPERYEAGEGAVDAPDPVAPDGTSWEEVRHMTFGAADLMFLLDIAGVDDARGAVEGWAGGEVTQWRRGEEVAASVSLVQHDSSDVDLCAAVQEWTDTLDDATTECDGDFITIFL